MGIFDKLKRKPERTVVEETAVEEVKEVKTVEPAAAKVKDATQGTASGVQSASATVLVKPVVTEKSLMMQADNKYTFFVHKNANKFKVAQAVKEVYGVQPEQVRIIKQQPQQLYRWGRKSGVQKARKKAIVTMPKGTTLDLTA